MLSHLVVWFRGVGVIDTIEHGVVSISLLLLRGISCLKLRWQVLSVPPALATEQDEAQGSVNHDLSGNLISLDQVSLSTGV